MAQIIHTCDAAGGFDLHYAIFEKSLTDSSSDDCFAVGLRNRIIGLNLFFEPSFPDIEIVARNDSLILDNGIYRSSSKQWSDLFSDQATEYFSETRRKLG